MIARALEPGGDVPADVHVLRVDLDFALPLSDPALAALSDDERLAATRFHRHEDAVRSAATRAALRRALGEALGEAPEALRFLRSDRGRPALDRGGTPAPLDFNVAHGGAHALVAWSGARRVGVDVEPARPGWDWRPLWRLALGEGDVRRIDGAAGEPARAALFLDAWTAKEALLKADGRGIAGGLDGFSVLPAEPPRPGGADRPVIAGTSALAAELRRFEARWIRDLSDHAACLAWARAPGLP